MTEASSERKNLFLVGFSMFMMILLSAVLQILAGMLFPEPFIEGNSWVTYPLMLVPQYLIAMPVAWLLLRHVPKTVLTKKPLSAGRVIIILLVCYAIMYAGALAAAIIESIIKQITGKDMLDLIEKMVRGSNVFANLLFVGIIAPVAEELFYRKLLIGRLLRYGEKAAVITSGLIFGLIHGNISQFFYAFGLGAAFGYIYVKTGKISYTIALHIFINIVSGIIGPLILQSGDDAMQIYGIVVMGMVITGIVMFFINKKRIWFAEGECKLEKWPAAVYLNTGMILFFIACAALFIMNTMAALEVPGL